MVSVYYTNNSFNKNTKPYDCNTKRKLKLEKNNKHSFILHLYIENCKLNRAEHNSQP